MFTILLTKHIVIKNCNYILSKFSSLMENIMRTLKVEKYRKHLNLICILLSNLQKSKDLNCLI